MVINRKLKKSEETLLKFLITKAALNLSWDSNLFVELMKDGGMGSLRLIPTNSKDERFFGKMVSECSFFDIDGIKVIASLYLDNNDELFEIDIWKTNFDQLKEIPENLNSYE